MATKQLRFIFIFSISSLLSGCYLKSVHPLVKPENSIQLAGLTGAWEDEEQSFTFIWDEKSIPLSLKNGDVEISFFDKPAEGEEADCARHLCGYLVMHQQKEAESTDTTLYLASVIELGSHYYMDLYPLDLSDPDLLSWHKFSVHTFSRVHINPDSLSIEFFKSRWIEEQIKNNRVRIKHEETDDGILITASTAELQRFVQKYGTLQEVYEKPIKLTRAE